MSKQLPPLPHWCEPGSPFAEQMQAYATAATEPLLQRIKELEEMNAQLREQNTEVDKSCSELERQLEEARKDAERWKSQADKLTDHHENTIYLYSLPKGHS